MNVSKEIVNVVDGLAERFGVVIDWSKDNVYPQIVDLCERFIQYKLIYNWAWFAIFAGILAVSIWLIIDVIKDHYNIKEQIASYNKVGNYEFYSKHSSWGGRNYYKSHDYNPSTHEVEGGYIYYTVIGGIKTGVGCGFALISIITLIGEIFTLIKLYAIPELCILDWIQAHM